jgi:hypothetical protein
MIRSDLAAFRGATAMESTGAREAGFLFSSSSSEISHGFFDSLQTQFTDIQSSKPISSFVISSQFQNFPSSFLQITLTTAFKAQPQINHYSFIRSSLFLSSFTFFFFSSPFQRRSH